jgi:hypothetical protein
VLSKRGQVLFCRKQFLRSTKFGQGGRTEGLQAGSAAPDFAVRDRSTQVKRCYGAPERKLDSGQALKTLIASFVYTRKANLCSTRLASSCALVLHHTRRLPPHHTSQNQEQGEFELVRSRVGRGGVGGVGREAVDWIGFGSSPCLARVWHD